MILPNDTKTFFKTKDNEKKTIDNSEEYVRSANNTQIENSPKSVEERVPKPKFSKCFAKKIYEESNKRRI